MMVDLLFQSGEEVGRDPLHHFQTKIQDQITKAEKHITAKMVMCTSNLEIRLSGGQCDICKGKIVHSLLQSDEGQRASGLGCRHLAFNGDKTS